MRRRKKTAVNHEAYQLAADMAKARGITVDEMVEELIRRAIDDEKKDGPDEWVAEGAG